MVSLHQEFTTATRKLQLGKEYYHFSSEFTKQRRRRKVLLSY